MKTISSFKSSMLHIKANKSLDLNWYLHKHKRLENLFILSVPFFITILNLQDHK